MLFKCCIDFHGKAYQMWLCDFDTKEDAEQWSRQYIKESLVKLSNGLYTEADFGCWVEEDK